MYKVSKCTVKNTIFGYHKFMTNKFTDLVSDARSGQPKLLNAVKNKKK